MPRNPCGYESLQAFPSCYYMMFLLPFYGTCFQCGVVKVAAIATVENGFLAKPRDFIAVPGVKYHIRLLRTAIQHGKLHLAGTSRFCIVIYMYINL